MHTANLIARQAQADRELATALLAALEQATASHAFHGSRVVWRAYACTSLTVRTAAATSSSGIPYIRANHEKLTIEASSSSSDMRCTGRQSDALTDRRERRLLARAR